MPSRKKSKPRTLRSKKQECEKQFCVKRLLANKNLITEKGVSMCSVGYCNEGCRNTIFEDKDITRADYVRILKAFSSKMSPSLSKQLMSRKNIKEEIPRMREVRKNLKRKNGKILTKDSFYVGLKGTRSLKQDGAISGCSPE